MNAKTQRANRFYAIATAAVLAALAALSITVWAFRPPTLDVATLCPTDRPVAGHTLVIVDRTDRWSPAVGETLTDLIARAQKETPQHAKFSIVALDSELSTRPVFSVCNPGEPTFWTDLYRGRRYTREDFDNKFLGAAERVVAEIRAPAEARASPIVEYVHRWLGRDDFNAGVPERKLILISDMRQNSPQLSVYTQFDEANLAQLVSREFEPASDGVRFDVYFITHGHDYNVPEAAVRRAWDHAFQTISAEYAWRQLD